MSRKIKSAGEPKSERRLNPAKSKRMRGYAMTKDSIQDKPLVTQAVAVQRGKTISATPNWDASVGRTGQTRDVKFHTIRIRIGNTFFTSHKEYVKRSHAEAAAKRFMKKYGESK